MVDVRGVSDWDGETTPDGYLSVGFDIEPSGLDIGSGEWQPPSDGINPHEVVTRTSYALWPGDGVFCLKVSAPKLADTFVLVDKDDRRMELRLYTHRMKVPKR